MLSVSDDTISLRHLPRRSSKNCDLQFVNNDRFKANYSIDYVKIIPFLAFPHLFSFLFWIFSSSSDIMLTFQKDCIFVTFLVILLIVHVSHPYKT